MVSHYGVFFKNDIPRIDVILRKLRENTGIDIQYFEDTWEIVNPNDTTDGISIYYQSYDGNDGITITVSHLDMNYLLGATLYVLVAFGGEFGHALPSWVSLKWKDYIQSRSTE